MGDSDIKAAEPSSQRGDLHVDLVREGAKHNFLFPPIVGHLTKILQTLLFFKWAGTLKKLGPDSLTLSQVSHPA